MVSRRAFLGSAAAVALAVGARPDLAGAHVPGGGSPDFGPLLAPDANGLALPAGFRSRVVARSGQPVGPSGYVWHIFPDGGATFRTRHGGWIYVSNSEASDAGGGVGALRFDRDGRLLDASSILTGSSRNCSGGPTPWGTWLSGEEVPLGKVWECDPTGRTPAIDRPALGRFSHEAAAVDDQGRRVYLTEDTPDGRLYRFTADRAGDLSRGRLDAARVDGTHVRWLPIPDPSAVTGPTRLQVPSTTAFAGGEGIWFHDDTVTFVTKHDHKVWRLDLRRNEISVYYDAMAATANGVLGEPDNITVTDRGVVFVSEDQNADQQIVMITPEGLVAPVVQMYNQTGSELTGLAFNPRGDRMYVSSQRGADNGLGPGITYEIRGPFRATQRRHGRGFAYGHDPEHHADHRGSPGGRSEHSSRSDHR